MSGVEPDIGDWGEGKRGDPLIDYALTCLQQVIEASCGTVTVVAAADSCRQGGPVGAVRISAPPSRLGGWRICAQLAVGQHRYHVVVWVAETAAAEEALTRLRRDPRFTLVPAGWGIADTARLEEYGRDCGGGVAPRLFILEAAFSTTEASLSGVMCVDALDVSSAKPDSRIPSDAGAHG